MERLTAQAREIQRNAARRQVREYRERNLPRMTWGEVFRFNDNNPLSEAQENALNAYFRQFTPWPTNAEGKSTCLCGSTLLSGIEGALMGGAPGNCSFGWGLQHGIAHCSVCKWPARIYHYDIARIGEEEPIIKQMTVMLLLHPDEVAVPEDKESSVH